MRNRVSLSLGVGVRAWAAASSPCVSSTPEPWLSLKAASQYAGSDEWTLRRRAKNSLLPHGKLRCNLRFNAPDIDAMMRNAAIATPVDVASVAGGAA